MYKLSIPLLLTLLAASAAADVVIPISSVEQFVNVRFAPDAKSEIVGRLRRGESMPYLRSIPGWHEVALQGGGTGFIHQDWCHVVDESLADEQTAEAAPLADDAQTEEQTRQASLSN